MHRIIFRLLETLRSSYWFVPSIMALLAILLGALMVWLDVGPATGWLDGIGWYQKAKPDGAHQVLSTIAGSMITVAGVVFSITIVAIAYAASQYGPRILTNFMSDRGNQITLGTFIATFVYCLVVLRTIRGGDEGEFVPQLAVMVGLLLALCSIAVLIFFIHHVPNSIHINNVVARIGKQLVGAVEKRFPAQVGDPPDEDHPLGGDDRMPLATASEPAAGKAKASVHGYIQAVDDDGLMELAEEHDLVLRLQQIPGAFVFKGSVLVLAWPAERLDENTEKSLRHCFSVGDMRTPTHDFYFLVDELVEIAARALSPGVNDPFTAITCLDWLSAAGAAMTGRRPPSPQRVDEEGKVRVISAGPDFESFVERGFGRMRQYVAGDMNAALHMLDIYESLAEHCGRPETVEPLARQADQLMALAEEKLVGPSLNSVRERYRKTKRRLS